jgi:hypothetical protein
MGGNYTASHIKKTTVQDPEKLFTKNLVNGGRVVRSAENTFSLLRLCSLPEHCASKSTG